MGRRYGQRPSSLLPKPFNDAYDALAFDYNVMLLGMAAEVKARNEAESKNDPYKRFTTSGVRLMPWRAAPVRPKRSLLLSGSR